MSKLVILTGAGISAESGLSTFRDSGGIWARHRIEDVATPEAFERDPARVQEFYNTRRSKGATVQPNAAHIALARLQNEWSGEVVIVTQNVDDLHEKGGARNVLHMHGTLAGALCNVCRHQWPAPAEMSVNEPCPACNAPAARPDVVWFGETPYHMDEIFDHLSSADQFVAIGTSGQVYPAAAFVTEAAQAGAQTLEINLEPSAVNSQFAEARFGPATECVPAWVNDILNAR
jgi:NAD-dependent protein deacetylase/lipoamidase